MSADPPTEVAAALEGVTKVYGQGDAAVHALRGVDLQLHAGEVAVVLGPSGSGKTTMLNILGGIETPTAGTVMIAGQDLAGRDPEDLAAIRRDNVAFVFQFFNLIQTLTAAENVRVIAELTGKGTGSDLDDRVHEAMGSVGLLEAADRFPGQISGGQQQRVAIARAMVTRPRLMLCDEPTGALDLERGREVLALLQQAAKRDGRCVVIVTHNSGIATMADVVVRVHDGVLAAVSRQEPGSAAEVEW